ncbi:cysteine desulfurase DndA [Acidicapsa dinghuensis]|uniref:cysteine desulfurase n=1 Tax=Acidicapsa dinghuensis TaxID=2218256 RepID=A0ABW1ELZ4_9BACT|nr:cysteine desulfurase DndA [Acidicapsa dinghuensis]
MSVYLDCNATTPMDSAVQSTILRFMAEEFGNSGSRTHEYGNRAKVAVQKARDQVAEAIGADRNEVIFTSGATESNNLAILGLAPFGERSGRRHIISTEIEHKAVLEPLENLQRLGFDVTLVAPEPGGYVNPDTLRLALRPDTLLVSVMHVNNETGVMQPLDEICSLLVDHPAYLHVDAAQGFGKATAQLRNRRIDLIGLTAHKIYGPKGVGALIARRRGFDRPPLAPLMFGGGQEHGMRPGTLPVPLIVGFGLAAELADKGAGRWHEKCLAYRSQMLRGLASLNPELNGDQGRVLPNTVSLSIPGLDSEAFMLATKGLIAVSNGSACTSQSYQPSHVLIAMGLGRDRVSSTVRLSWCHLTPPTDWDEVVAALKRVL